MEQKCIILSRVSTLIQDLNQQTEAVKKQALEDGFNDIILIEDKESAVKLDEESRLGLTKLKQMILNDESIKCVYAYELSRIGRRPDVNYSIRNFLQDHRVQLIIMKPYMKVFDENFNINETSNVMFGLFNVLSENEGFIRKERFKRGRLAKQKQGKYVGGKITFGFTKDDEKNLVIDPETSETVKLVFDMFVRQRKSCWHIGKELLATGCLHCKSYHGACNSVLSMLSNDAYIGKSSRGGNIYPRLIDNATFKKAQKILEQNKQGIRTSSSHNFLCKGLIRDKHSGYLLTAKGKKRYYFLNNNLGNHMETLSMNVSRILFDSFFTYIIETRYGEIEQIDIEERKKNADRQISQNERKIANAEKTISECDKKTKKIQMRIIDGKLEEKLGDELLAEIQDKRLYAELDLNHYKGEATNLNAYRMSLDIIWPNEKTVDSEDTEGMENMRKKLFRIVRVVYVEKTKELKGITGKFEIVFTDGHIETYWYNSWNKKVWDENRQEVRYKLVA